MRRQRTGWLLLAPSLIILFLTGFLPFIYVLVVGFFSWNPVALNPAPLWTGAENFRRLVFDVEFLGCAYTHTQFYGDHRRRRTAARVRAGVAATARLSR